MTLPPGHQQTSPGQRADGGTGERRDPEQPELRRGTEDDDEKPAVSTISTSSDWSMAWFHGTARTRAFARVPLPPGSPTDTVTSVQQRFPQVDVLVADAAGTLGRIGWRTEVAYSRYHGADTIFRKNDNLWLVAGFDTDTAGWNVNLQYSLRRAERQPTKARSIT